MNKLKMLLPTSRSLLKPARHLCFLFLCLAASGCAKDPVATLLKKNGGFATVRPPSSQELLGDVHRASNLQAKSIDITDVISEDAAKSLMARRAKSVDLPTLAGGGKFTLDLSATYVGIISGELKTQGIHSYSVKVGNPQIFDSPIDSELTAVLLPAIKAKYPRVELDGKYIVRSLLKVETLEYTFFSNSGTQVKLEPSDSMIANVKARLGGSWEINRAGSLATTGPRFIGYRVAKIIDLGTDVMAAPGARVLALTADPVPLETYKRQ